MIILCPQCQKRLEVDDGLVGQQVKCPGCDLTFEVPAGSSPPAGPAVGPRPAPGPAPSTPAPNPVTASLGAGRARRRPSSMSGALGFDTFFGKILIAVGFVVVIVARGCDSISSRAVKRADARVNKMDADFADKWDRKMANVDPESKTSYERYQKLRDERNDAKRELSRSSEYLDAQQAQRDSMSKGRMNAYWHEWAFVLGSVVLSLGLLAVGLGGEGGERIFCLIMLAIITFSVYVGGVPWISSITEPLMIR